MKKKNEFKSSKDIVKGILDGFKIDDSKNVVDWVLKNHIKTEENTFIHYNERKYLIDFMNDLTPKQSIMASAQVSKTVSMQIKALFMNYKGMNVAFSQPTQDLRDLLTKSKLNRIIENNDIFRNNVSGDLNIKTSFDKMLFLVYTFGNAQVGYSTDLNIYDEVSRSNPETIDMLKSRQLDSKFGWEWFISNPSVPNDLLHNTFIQSSQKHWAIKCQACSKHQILNYDGLYGYKGNINKETAQIHCQYCDFVIDPSQVINGQWVERFPGREIAGYWIHQLMRPTPTLEAQSKLVKDMIYEEKKNKSKFMNFYLGLPYSGSDVNIDRTLFMKNRVEPTRFKNYVCMGVDIGSATGHHYTIGSGDTIFKIGRAKDWAEIRQLMKEYEVQMCVVDNMPENGPAKEFQAEYPNMVWRGNYVANKSEQVIKYEEESGLVHIARNLVFDDMISSFSKGEYKFAFSEFDGMFDEYIDHWGTMSKIAEFDRWGNPTFKWEAPNGAWDHFAHSTLYYHIARHRLEELMPRFGITKSDDGEVYRDLLSSRDSEGFFGTKEGKNWLDL